jgi:hypothetical protein
MFPIGYIHGHLDTQSPQATISTRRCAESTPPNAVSQAGKPRLMTQYFGRNKMERERRIGGKGQTLDGEPETSGELPSYRAHSNSGCTTEWLHSEISSPVVTGLAKSPDNCVISKSMIACLVPLPRRLIVLPALYFRSSSRCGESGFQVT